MEYLFVDQGVRFKDEFYHHLKLAEKSACDFGFHAAINQITGKLLI
jgi:hypothetical protein